jgi:hypothetical protein
MSVSEEKAVEERGTMLLWNLFNTFHIHALNGQFNPHNETNKCTYVKCVYRKLFITDMFDYQRHRQQDNLQVYMESKQSVKMHEWTTQCHEACLKFLI